MAEFELPQVRKIDMRHRDPVILLQFEDVEPNFPAHDQRPKRRTVIYTPGPDPRIAAIQHWKYLKRDREPRVDLTAVNWEETGVVENEIFSEIGHMPGLGEIKTTPPRYPEMPEPLVSREQSYQDENPTWPGHILRKKGLLPEPGVRQERRPMPDPSQTRIAREHRGRRRWS